MKIDLTRDELAMQAGIGIGRSEDIEKRNLDGRNEDLKDKKEVLDE